MPYYRLYRLNRSSGHIDRADEFEAADDVNAVAIARERERDTAVELWQEGRKVLRLEAPADTAPRPTRRMLGIAAAG